MFWNEITIVVCAVAASIHLTISTISWPRKMAARIIWITWKHSATSAMFRLRVMAETERDEKFKEKLDDGKPSRPV